MRTLPPANTTTITSHTPHADAICHMRRARNTGVPLVSKRNPGVVVDKLGHAALELSETAPGFQWHTDKGDDFWRDSAPARSDFRRLAAA